MSDRLIELVESHDYRKLFLQNLHWSAPAHRAPVLLSTDEGQTVTAVNVSSYKGVSVWVCDRRPGSALEAQLDQLIAKQSVDRLTIFYDTDEQVWRWPVRRTAGGSTTTRLSSHRHITGQPNPNFVHRLNSIRIDWNQPLDATGLIARVREAFDVEAQNETRQASKLMARMYTSLEACGTPEHDISISLARVLFLMFGDDTDMWEAGLFQHFIAAHTQPDGSDLADRLNELFMWLDTADKDRGPTPEHLRGFKYVNGGIFNEVISLPALKAEFRDAVLEACQRDWAAVSPAIFGSMFQSVRDAKTRRNLGEHYTSEENILKTLNPLFLDELRADFEVAKTKANEKLALTRLRNKLGEIRFLDPACGCGNFIIIAYRELREIELRIMERLQEITGEDQMLLANVGLKVNLDNFYGIEIDEWPAKIAETAMFLMDRQADLKLIERLGWAPDRLPIRRQATIVVGNALRLDWEKVFPASDTAIIAGNPPFIGTKERSPSQTNDLRLAWGKRYDGYMDYVTGWFAKAANHLADGKGRWAFVCTNSVTMGQAVPSVFSALRDGGWRIKFAYRTFPWTSEASGKAAVHCVIVGFTKERTISQRLFGYSERRTHDLLPISHGVNSYLADGPDVLVRKRMKPLGHGLPEVTAGSKAVDWGYLTLDEDDFAELSEDPVVRPYILPYLGGEELINNERRWCLWLVHANLEAIQENSNVAERLATVRKLRLESPKAATRKAAATPHLFEQRRQPLGAYLGIPQTFSDSRRYATVARLPETVIASIKLFTAQDSDGYLFGVISSSMFLTWQRTVGARMKSDPSFTNTIVWNTLPIPPVSQELRAQIALAGKSVLAARELAPDKSLAEHYKANSMDPALLAAHDSLDVLVDKAFGAAGPCQSEQERQTVLFQRYQEMTADLLTYQTARKPRLRK
ncbi:class I SAM-dependent DNA methyltransferase [Streptomyces sp. MAR25Y5]|uniref:class I SAM-dependent DNA methyltransferase n=1 Tax=Streptomyces sp. MAR25Y5 TaxID=2962028 RepID=UPI0020B80535|nr:DNA methyltransferase [Streptomyces sp. MAR25Y5]MCP3769617.1 N-6 DNA methylase [Streptomyces sp. MAR25Y5]